MLVRVGDGPAARSCHPRQRLPTVALWVCGVRPSGGRPRRWWASVNLDPASVAQRLWQQTRLEHPTINIATPPPPISTFVGAAPLVPPGMLPLPSMPFSFRTEQAAMGVDVVAGGTRKWHLGAIGPRGLCSVRNPRECSVLRSPCRQPGSARQLRMLPDVDIARHNSIPGRREELPAMFARKGASTDCGRGLRHGLPYEIEAGYPRRTRWPDRPRNRLAGSQSMPRPKLQARGLMMWWFHFRHDAKRVGIVIIETQLLYAHPIGQGGESVRCCRVQSCIHDGE
jgi:hypothetical protein